MSDHWYFAYGSNLLTEQKVERTGPIRECKRARLDGYRLTFNKRGDDDTGKANIVPDASSSVWGVVYRCNDAALLKMDKREGVSGGHYKRTTIRVRLDGESELEVITYVAGDSFIDDSCSPMRSYLNRIIDGAREHGLPDSYIREIEAVVTVADR